MGKRANGEGSICKRADGRFQAKIQVGYYPDGKTKFKTFTGKTQAECRKKLDNFKNQLSTHTVSSNDNLLLNTWIDKWFEIYQIPNNANTTLVTDKGRIENHIKPYFVKKKIIDIQPHFIQEFYNYLLSKNLSAKTIKSIHGVLRKCLQQAFENKIIYYNPCDMVKLPRQESKEVDCFTVEEQEKFILAIHGNRLELAYLLLLFTGMRRGELLGLKWEDYDKDNRTITIQRALYNKPYMENGIIGKSKFYFTSPKTKASERTIYIPSSLISLINEHKIAQNKEKLLAGKSYQDNGMIFCDELGNFIHPDTFGEWYRKILKTNNIRHLKLHGLRHTYATRLLEENASMKDIQKLLGHASYITTANIYTHVTPKQQSEVVEKLNKFI